MSDFVTAPKVWLSILIKMYCNGQVREQDHTNYLSFITSCLLPGLALGKSSGPLVQAEQVTLANIQKQLEYVVPNAHPANGHSFGGYRNLWLIFVYHLCSIVHLNDLGKALCDIEDMVIRPQKIPEAPRYKACILSPNSLFGAFLMRLQLSWSQMPFETQMKVWHDFMLPMTELLQRYPDMNGGLLAKAVLSTQQQESDNSLEASLQGLILRHNMYQPPSTISEEDLTLLLHFQTEQMEKYGARLDHTTQKTLQDTLARAGTTSAMSHYFNFLSSWRAGDYYSALDNLHRHFDYTIPNQSHSRYPYACLNMAVLQADFGCHEEALPAIAEAINAARESSDHSCLAFCLSWLYHFRLVDRSEETQIWANKMLGADDGGLTYLRQQARRYELRSLESSILVSQARGVIARGARPLEAFELLHESSALNLKYNLPSVSGDVLLLQSCLYANLGLKDISNAYMDLVDFWYTSAIPVAQRVNVHCNKALDCLLSGESEEVDQHLAAARKEAASNIKHLGVVTLHTNLIRLKRAIFSDDVYDAEIILHTLKSAPSIDPSITWAISLEEVSFLTRSRDFTKAFTVVEKLLASISDSPIDAFAPVHLRIRLLNAKARIFTTAGRPQKALSIVLRAAAAAQKAKAMVILWESMALLMEVLCSLKRYKVAIDIGNIYSEQVRAIKDKRLLAELQLWMSKAFAFSKMVESPADAAEQDEERKQEAKGDMLIEAGDRADKSLRLAHEVGDKQLEYEAAVMHDRLRGNEMDKDAII